MLEQLIERVERVKQRAVFQHSRERGHCSLDIPFGWADLIDKLADQLESLPYTEWPRIVQVKEKFASLCVYTDGQESDLTKAAIGFATGRSRRTCQICGCRGRQREIGACWVTVCSQHRAAFAKSASWDEITRAPGADDAPSAWLLRIVDVEGRPSIEVGNLYTSRRVATIASTVRSLAFLAGLLEPDDLVMAENPNAVTATLAGAPLPVEIRDVETTLMGLAITRECDQVDLYGRLDVARTTAGQSPYRAWGALWRWASGVNQ